MAYKKTNEIVKIIPEFDGQNISVNQFIRKCKDAENFVDPVDKDFYIRLAESKVIGNARSYLQCKSFLTLNHLLIELKRSFAPTQNLPQIQTDLARVSQQQNEKVSEYGLRVTKILQKATEYINEHFEISAAKGMVDGSKNVAIECFILGLNEQINHRMINVKPSSLEVAIDCESYVKQQKELRGDSDGHSKAFCRVTETNHISGSKKDNKSRLRCFHCGKTCKQYDPSKWVILLENVDREGKISNIGLNHIVLFVE